MPKYYSKEIHINFKFGVCLQKIISSLKGNLSFDFLETIIIYPIQHFEANFLLWKVCLKILISGIIPKTLSPKGGIQSKLHV